jgi:hypothetical protein
MSRVLLALVTSWSLVGCGSKSPTGPGPVPTADGGVTADGGASIPQALRIELDGPVMAPGTEKTFCTIRRLPNEDVALVRKIESSFNQGSHHVILYRADETEERIEPFDCTPFTELIQRRSVPLLISQVHEEQLPLPEGVVYELEPHQMVRVEAHYINLGSSNITPRVSLALQVTPDEPGLERADFLLFGTPDIDIARNSAGTTGARFVKGIPAGAKIYAMTTHTHQWGTQFRIQRSTSRSDPGTPLYEYPDWAWDEPPVLRFDPPLTLEQGEGFRFTCDYMNRSNERVRFGESALAEMCVFWVYYYPSQGYRLCLDTDLYNAGEVCCPGHFACGAVSF